MAKKTVGAGLSNLKKQLADGTYKNIYLFCGEEDFLREYYFNQLKKNIVDESFADFNFAVFEGAKLDLDEIKNALDTPPMMAEYKMVLIKYSGIFVKANEEVKKFWADAFSCVDPNVMIVFYEDEIDKRGVLYKAVDKDGEVVECAPLEGVELINWIGRGCRAAGKVIGQSEAEYLIRSCDGGMNNIKRELEKLFSFCEEKIKKSDIDKIVTKMPQSRVFDMVNALMKKDAKTVFNRLDELKVLKESAFMVLAMLYNNFEKIFYTKILLESSKTPNEIVAKIKVPPYFVRDYIDAAKKSDKKFLRKSLSSIAEIDYAIKQGRVDEWVGVEKFLAQCMM